MKKKIVQEGTRYFFMVVACVLYAISLDVFLVPNNIVGGGVSGASIIVNNLCELGVGVWIILLNIPILILGLKTQGIWFVLRCLLTTTVLGLATEGLVFLEPITHEPIMASLYGGIVQGISVGLFCKFRVSSGGTELLGRIISDKLKRFSIPTMIAVLDALIVISGAIVFQNPEIILYALIVIFVGAKVSDVVIVGFNKAHICYIITEHPEEISECLLANSPRGITNLRGIGMYTRVDKSVLMTVIKKQQLSDLKLYVNQIDPQAFVVVGEATEVLGKGFKEIDDQIKD